METEPAQVTDLCWGFDVGANSFQCWDARTGMGIGLLELEVALEHPGALYGWADMIVGLTKARCV